MVAAVKYDLVKMDKSLIWPAFEPNNEQARTIMIACIKMFHTLGISVVAERKQGTSAKRKNG